MKNPLNKRVWKASGLVPGAPSRCWEGDRGQRGQWTYAATEMDLHHAEWSNSDREVSRTSLTCGIQKEVDTNELTKQETHRLRKLTYSCQGEGIVSNVHTAVFK